MNEPNGKLHPDGVDAVFRYNVDDLPAHFIPTGVIVNVVAKTAVDMSDTTGDFAKAWREFKEEVVRHDNDLP